MIAALALAVSLTVGGYPDEPVTRCDRVVETCRNAADSPWPNSRYMGDLCAARAVFCRYIEGRPAVVGGYRAGDQVGNRGPVTDEVLWAVWDNFEPLQHQRAIHVTACESSFDPYARNRHSTATGILQYLAGAWRRETAYWNQRGHRFDTQLDARYRIDEVFRLTSLVVERDGSWRQWACKNWRPR